MKEQEFPLYQSHKKVRAVKIVNIEHLEEERVLLTPEEPFEPFEVTIDWMTKRGAAVGGYYVQYEDGYTSYSPAGSFEKGNTLCETYCESAAQPRDPSELRMYCLDIANRIPGITAATLLGKAEDLYRYIKDGKPASDGLPPRPGQNYIGRIDRKFNFTAVNPANGKAYNQDDAVVFCAKDAALPAALEAYALRCKDLGVDHNHVLSVKLLINRVMNFQQQVENRIPDTVGEAELARCLDGRNL